MGKPMEQSLAREKPWYGRAYRMVIDNDENRRMDNFYRRHGVCVNPQTLREQKDKIKEYKK